MKIKTIINGREIVGFWNGKTYKSKKDPEKNIRIYIDNVEYDIPKSEFKYEEVYSEKQLQYAKELKEKFLEKLNKIFENHPLNPDEETKNVIIRYFKNKEPKYFLDLKDNNSFSVLLENIHFAPSLIEKLIKKDFQVEIIKTKEKNLDLELLKELAVRMLVKKSKYEHFGLYKVDPEFSLYEDKENYYIKELSTIDAYRINKKTKEIERMIFDDIPKETKKLAIFKLK